MSKPEDISQEAWDAAIAVFGPPNVAVDVEDIARAIMAAKAEERTNGDEMASVLKDILAALRQDAPGTPLNNHKYDALGIRAYDAIRKREHVNTAYKNKMEA